MMNIIKMSKRVVAAAFLSVGLIAGTAFAYANWELIYRVPANGTDMSTTLAPFLSSTELPEYQLASGPDVTYGWEATAWSCEVQQTGKFKPFILISNVFDIPPKYEPDHFGDYDGNVENQVLQATYAMVKEHFHCSYRSKYFSRVDPVTSRQRQEANRASYIQSVVNYFGIVQYSYNFGDDIATDPHQVSPPPR
jgi:hypothetical protein